MFLSIPKLYIDVYKTLLSIYELNWIFDRFIGKQTSEQTIKTWNNSLSQK